MNVEKTQSSVESLQSILESVIYLVTCLDCVVQYVGIKWLVTKLTALGTLHGHQHQGGLNHLTKTVGILLYDTN